MEASAAAPLPKTWSAAISALLQGQDSAMKLRDLFVARADHLKPTIDAPVDNPCPPTTVEDLVGDVFRSFTSVLSMLNSGETDESSQSQQQVPPASAVFSGCNPTKSEESSRESSQTHSSIRKDKRGCYKRRRSSVSWTKLCSNYGDDGYQWRKYGQKSILNTSFPRSYFRCTHKVDQGCQATKQVQQMSSDPPMYQSIYHGEHTCQNFLKNTPIIVPDDDLIPGKTVVWSFKTDKSGDGTDSKKNNFSRPLSAVKSEINEVTAATNCTGTSNNQSSSSSEYRNFPSPDFTMFKSKDHGESLSSSNSFVHDMGLTMDDVDFNMLDCHFPSS